MEVFKTNKLKFKFGLPSAVSSELKVIKDIAQKAIKKVDKKSKNRNKRQANEQNFINKYANIKTSQKVLPPEIRLMIDYLYTLRQKSPATFPPSTRPSLKKGITKDIALNLNISHNMAKKFIAWYSFSKEYLRLHKAGEPRYDLDGNIVGVVTEQEEQEKQILLNKLWAKGATQKPES